MVEITDEQLEQLEIIKKNLSKLSLKQRIKLLSDKGVKQLLEESKKELKQKKR